MTDLVAFQDHHVHEQQAGNKSALLDYLTQQGLFNVEDPRNHLNLPASKELAAKMGITPHNGGPLGEYSKQLAGILTDMENSAIGQAAMAGDQAAASELAADISGLRDSMRAAHVNGDLFTNTPMGMTSASVGHEQAIAIIGDALSSLGLVVSRKSKYERSCKLLGLSL